MSNTPVKSPRYTVTLSGSMASVVKYGIIEYLRSHRIARIGVTILGVSTAILGVFVFFNQIPRIQFGFGYLIAILGGYLIWLATVAGTDFEVRFPAEDATKERQKAELELNNSHDPYALLNLDFKRLNEYYVINQAQARASFRWAVVAMLFGFATIIAGVWLFYFRRDTPDTFIASLSTAAGLIVNLVSGLFLYLHHKTQERSLHYYQQLSQIQKIALAIRLVEAQPDGDAKIDARNRVITELLRMTIIVEGGNMDHRTKADTDAELNLA